MTKSELLKQLEHEGLRATGDQVEHAIRSGRVRAVSVDGAGNRVYRRQHVEQLRRYLASPRPRGRRPRGLTQDCCSGGGV